MAHSKEYQHLLNSKEWRQLRFDYLSTHPLCEVCKAQGLYVSATAVHHREPVEGAKTDKEMHYRCFAWANLQALCKECHAKTHTFMKRGTKQQHQERAKEDLQRWEERIRRHPRRTG